MVSGAQAQWSETEVSTSLSSFLANNVTLKKKKFPVPNLTSQASVTETMMK